MRADETITLSLTFKTGIRDRSIQLRTFSESKPMKTKTAVPKFFETITLSLTFKKGIRDRSIQLKTSSEGKPMKT